MIDVTRTIELLTEVVEEAGRSYRYTTRNLRFNGADCFYREPDGSPSCIVARVVAKVDPSAVAHLQERIGAYRVLSGLGIFHQEAMELLAFAQSLQDDGTPWGEILDAVMPNHPTSESYL